MSILVIIAVLVDDPARFNHIVIVLCGLGQGLHIHSVPIFAEYFMRWQTQLAPCLSLLCKKTMVDLAYILQAYFNGWKKYTNYTAIKSFNQ